MVEKLKKENQKKLDSELDILSDLIIDIYLSRMYNISNKREQNESDNLLQSINKRTS